MDKRSPIFTILTYTPAYGLRIYWAAFCSVLNKLFDIAPEILIGVAIDVVVNQETSFIAQLGLVDPLHQIYALGALTFFVWVGESAFEYAYLLAWRGLAQDLQHDLRRDAYAHVQQLDLSYVEDRRLGDLIAILNDDVNQLERFLNGGANSLIQVATTVIAVGGVFFLISPLIASLAFLPIPVILWGAFFFQRRAQPHYRSVREKAGLLSARLANNLAGMMTIKSFTAEDRELQRLDQESRNYVEANRAAIAVSSAFIPLIRMAILSGFLLTFLIGGWMTLNGELQVGAYGLLVFLTQRLLWPLTSLAETVDLYERAMASARRIIDLLAAPVKVRSGQQAPESVSGSISFHNVSFAYHPDQPVLQGIDFQIKAGQTIAFVGHTGSGKSTIAKLLLRFYQPDDGVITLDGLDISELDLTTLRQAIGFVSQDVFLFHGSVAENIRFGQPSASDGEVASVARLAEAHTFIKAMPDGYQTLVGERGQKLSGGQRQRLSIARALLKNPPILLLDEATSAVDNETEAAIQRSLRRISKQRTTLIIAHRLSTIVHADQIIVLDAGRIVEQGRHQELLDSDGVYAGLWRVQTGIGS